MPKFIKTLYVYVFHRPNILYFHFFSLFASISLWNSPVAGWLGKCIKVHKLFATVISRTMYGLSFTFRFLAKIGVFEEAFSCLCISSLRKLFLDTHRMRYFPYVWSRLFWKKKFYYLLYGKFFRTLGQLQDHSS